MPPGRVEFFEIDRDRQHSPTDFPSCPPRPPRCAPRPHGLAPRPSLAACRGQLRTVASSLLLRSVPRHRSREALALRRDPRGTGCSRHIQPRSRLERDGQAAGLTLDAAIFECPRARGDSNVSFVWVRWAPRASLFEWRILAPISLAMAPARRPAGICGLVGDMLDHSLARDWRNGAQAAREGRRAMRRRSGSVSRPGGNLREWRAATKAAPTHCNTGR